MSRLDSLDRCRREAARLYWAGRRQEIGSADASRLASVLQLVSVLLERGQIEQRIAAIEARLA